MTNNEHRAIELQFYCVVQLLYEIKRDANFLVSMLEGLHFVVDFDVEKIIDYAIFVRQGEVVMQGDAEQLRTQYGKSIVDMYKEIYKYD